MSKGWERLEREHHDEIIALVVESYEKWPRWACLMDLRAKQGECIGTGCAWPSSGEWANRWGWGKTSAYRLVKSEAWHDPARAQKWAAYCAEHGLTGAKDQRLERRWNDGGTTVERTEPTTSGSLADSGTVVEREWNASGHTHVGDNRQPTTDNREDTHTSGKPAEVSDPAQTGEAEQGGEIHQLRLAPTIDPPPEKPQTPIDHFGEVLDVYLAAATEHAQRTGGRQPRTPRLRPSVGRGVHLAARIKDHGPEAVKLVVRWWQVSGDERAQLLRGEVPGKGPYSWDTVCRPGNFETYLEMAERWEDLGAVESAGSSADLDREAHEAWVFLRRCIEDRAFYRREIPDPRSPTWPHRIRATLDRIGTSFNDLQRSSLYELDRIEGRFTAAHTQLRRGTA